MTTEAAAPARPRADGERAALAAELTGLESRPVSDFRDLSAPAEAIAMRAAELDAPELVQRARLLEVGVLLRLGRSADGGRRAHQILAWAQQHGDAYLTARAHRELCVFFRQVGSLTDALTHALQGVAHLADAVTPSIRARHLMSLAVALDDNGSHAEAQRRYAEALDIAVATADHDLTLCLLNNMAYTAYENGDEGAATRLIGRMEDARSRLERPFSANELDTIARVHLMAGRYADVETALHPVLDAGQSALVSNEGDALAECLLTLTEARRVAGDFPQAQLALDAAVRMCEERGLQGVRTRAREEQAVLYACTGRFREAYEEHRAFHADATALHCIQREARAGALQAVFEATEARRASEHFREMAHRDALTGLHNRRHVNDRLPALLGDAAARDAPISVAILDLDHFKQINDTLSHSVGDEVLQQLARLLAEAATGSEIAARLGGEEFLLILPDVGAAEAVERCERLRRRIREHDWTPITGGLPVTTSIGVTTADSGRSSVSALLSQADRNLYAAKRDGRDRVVRDAAPGLMSNSTSTG
ncbi:GGDEF domain-containing protein [Mangrovihabitans endophyticus]|uniref:GGDEF domain-containing protein n=1 Tax=Mangrovihabitans endophyticus TaxID=1751298 RepID=A0A8J3BY65_9ACTN|nr:GGDEF domain-containing protein [Mangrovihabitans endophyticus]GGK81223.1 hypothetical protein GCM10012284_13950 [Mangrovihabitans endophyticus]